MIGLCFRLSKCDVSEGGCEALAMVLSSEMCSLTELNLSFNTLEDSGIKLLCSALKSPWCKLGLLW